MFVSSRILINKCFIHTSFSKTRCRGGIREILFAVQQILPTLTTRSVMIPILFNGFLVSHGGNKQFATVFKGNKATVEQVVNRRRKQQAVALEQPLAVVGFPPWFDMAGDQMFGPVHARDAAEVFHVRDFLTEQALAASGFDERLFFSFGQLAIFRNLRALRALPIPRSRAVPAAVSPPFRKPGCLG